MQNFRIFGRFSRGSQNFIPLFIENNDEALTGGHGTFLGDPRPARRSSDLWKDYIMQ